MGNLRSLSRTGAAWVAASLIGFSSASAALAQDLTTVRFGSVGGITAVARLGPYK